MACIYKITNTINGKVYIGQTTKTPDDRLREHYEERGAKRSFSRPFKVDLRTFGISNFKAEIIVFGNFNQMLLHELEKHYIQMHASTFGHIGYNMTKGGFSYPDKMYSDEVNKKKSEKMKGWKLTKRYEWTDEAKKKASDRMMGNTRGKKINKNTPS